MKKIKLTRAMFNQLMGCLERVKTKKEYWGNKDLFWERQRKIEEWVFDKFNHGE